MVGGLPHRPGSYERLEPVIRQILADNPSIQMVIDLHRDGVGEHVAPMVTYINGKRTAQIMLVNGLQRRYRNGIITNVYHLPNPYQRDNLAFSLNLQLAANQLYPGLARRIYLLEFRYSLHMAPLSILLEVGAQNNTFQEALNAMHPMANIIAAVVLPDE
jgi:stage II sporulation protein P